MPQQVRSRRQATLTISSFSQKITQQLGRGMIYRELGMRLYGSLTYAAAANNTTTTLGRGDEWSVITRIDVVVNGSDIIRSFSGTQLMMLNRVLYGGIKRFSPTLGDGATAAPTVDSTLIVPFWMPLAVRPMDTALDSSKVSDLRLEITIGASTDVNSANGPTAIACSLDVYSVESFGIEGTFSDCRIYSVQSVYAGANAQAQINLPVGPLYRGLLFNAAATSAVTAADASGSLTNIKLQSGTTVFRDWGTRVLKDWQSQRLNFNRQFIQLAANAAGLGNASNYLRMVKSANHDEDAWFWLDLVQDGYLSEGIDTVAFSEFTAELNIAAATTVTLLPIAVYPVRNAA